LEWKQQDQPLLVILSGPSGVGKDAVMSSLKQLGYPLHYAVTMTTRPRRDGEKEGVDYYFVSQEKFKRMIENDELLEWANVYGNLYGIPKRQIREAMHAGQDTIVRIDIQGARTIKQNYPEAIFIFLAVPTIEELEQRLLDRNTESSKNLELRIQAVRNEMESLFMFDYIVINHRDQLKNAAEEVASIITAEKCKVIPRKVEL